MIFLLILSGMFLWTGNLANASCVLQLSPPRVFVAYGASLSANCSSTSDISSMGWESPAGGTGLIKGVTSLPLNIPSVTTWDLEPQCYANVRNVGGQCITSLKVTVYKLPESVTISRLSGPLLEDQRYQMTCIIVNIAPVNRLVVNWYRDSKTIFTQAFNEFSPSPQSVSSAFDFTAHRNDSQSTIWCEATLKFEPDEENPPPSRSESRQLTVLSPPKFDAPSNETVTLPAGKTVTLDCAATGNPTPEYRWRFPDAPIETESLQSVKESTVTPVFPVVGTYACTASNSRGSSTKHFHVVQASENQTTFGVLLGVFITAGVLLLVSGLFFVTQNGTFSFNKNGYTPGQPAPSGPV